MAEPAQPQHVLEDRPRRAPLPGPAGDLAGDRDPQPVAHRPARSSSRPRTLSESKCSSARARAACEWWR